jgi:hypothetical protein
MVTQLNRLRLNACVNEIVAGDYTAATKLNGKLRKILLDSGVFFFQSTTTGDRWRNSVTGAQTPTYLDTILTDRINVYFADELEAEAESETDADAILSLAQFNSAW